MLKDMHSLFEDFEYKGFWWLPTDPENKVPGTLIYKSGDRMMLELLGSLSEDEQNSNALKNHTIVQGVAEGHRICTLQRLLHTNSSFIGGNEAYRSSYIVNRLFEGKHFASPDEIRFSSISINYTSLEDWITDCPYEEGHEKDESSQTLTITASRKVPYPVFEVNVPSISATISASLEFEGSIGIRTLRWKSTGFIHILPEHPSSFEWFWGIQSDIRNLLTLLMNEPTHPTRIRAYGNDVEETPGRTSKETIYIYYVNAAGASDKEMHPSDMLMILPEIKDNLAPILNEWFSKAQRLRPVYTLFFGSMYFSKLFDRFHLLNLIQAVESFHRGMRQGTYTSDEIFQKVADTLNTAIPEEVTGGFRQSLKSRIRFANEYSLRTRMKHLFQELEPETKELITRDVSTFIDNIVDTRNFFTHYPLDFNAEVLDSGKLRHANHKLRVVLIILLLKEVGLSEVSIRKAVCGNNELTYGLAKGSNF
jgi:hypothetical protein